MRRALPTRTVTVLFALPIFASGCMQIDRYQHLLEAKRTVEEQVVRSQEERDTARANLDTALVQLSQTQTELESLEVKYDRLVDDVDREAERTDQALDLISRLEPGPLPPDVASALESLSLSYPSLLAFDSRRGMLRFASDFTFNLGSDALKSDAMATIVPLAGILNSQMAALLEVRIVGHTDTVAIKRADTRRRHPSNLHLSVHRAIAVRDALVDSGVQPARIEVAGDGEFRPIVPNGPRGAAENRRVEIFLAPLPQTVEPVRPLRRRMSDAPSK